MSRTRACTSILAVLGLILLATPCAHASEGGQSSYIPGFQDVLSGFLPPPGFYFKEAILFYTGNAARTTETGGVAAGVGVPFSNRIEVNLHEYLPVQFSIFSQVTKTRLLGSYYSWALIVPLADPSLSGQIVTPQGRSYRSQSLSALGELEMIPFVLGWHNGRSHQKAWINIYAPTGKYNVDSFVYTSLNHWAFECDYAYTFLDPKTGREFDAAPGYTFNSVNAATHYHNGQEFHVDMAALQHLSPAWGLGAVGFALVQTTPDSGSGAMLGAFEGRAFALGPIVTYNTNLGGVPISMTGKYYGEFGVLHRFEGHAYWFNVNASF